MLPVTTRIPQGALGRLEADCGPTQADFEALLQNLENRDDTTALDRIARQLKLVALTDESCSRTALHWAACWGCGSRVIDALLHASANFEAMDRFGYTPLMCAAEGGHRDAITALLHVGANLEATNNIGWTALMFAATNGHRDATNALLYAGANPEVKTNSHGYTPLMGAAWHGHRDVIEALLRAGANPDTTNNDGLTALGLAEKKKQHAAVKALQFEYLNRDLSLRNAE